MYLNDPADLDRLTISQKEQLDRAVKKLIAKAEWIRVARGVTDPKRCIEEAISWIAINEYIPHKRLRAGYQKYLDSLKEKEVE